MWKPSISNYTVVLVLTVIYFSAWWYTRRTTWADAYRNTQLAKTNVAEAGYTINDNESFAGSRSFHIFSIIIRK